tara:strand:+ start:212 stop:532 length:321 start_codon:yes stop_codon:yes gene_type:complete
MVDDYDNEEKKKKKIIRNILKFIFIIFIICLFVFIVYFYVVYNFRFLGESELKFTGTYQNRRELSILEKHKVIWEKIYDEFIQRYVVTKREEVVTKREEWEGGYII